MSKAR